MKKVFNFFKHSLVVWILFLLALIIAGNYIFSSFIVSFDATSDRRYSFSDSTVSLIKKLDNPIEIRFYHSLSNKNAAIGLKNFGKRVEKALTEFERLSKGKVKLFVYDPKPDSDEELAAVNYGIASNSIGAQSYFLGAVLTSGIKEQVIEFFDPSRERFLEYDIVRIIYSLTTETKNKIGILSSLNLFGVEATPYTPETSDAFFVSELKQLFDVVNLDYGNTTSIDEDIDLLIVFHPQNIKVHVEYAIDQFLMRGGKLIMVYDSYMRTDPNLINARRSGNTNYISSSVPQRFLDSWQIEYDSESVLGDREFAAVVQSGQGSFSYALWFNGNNRAMNQEIAITAGVNDVLFPEPAAFRFKASEGDKEESNDLKFIPIVSTSDSTGFVNVFAVSYIDLEQLNANMKAESGRWHLMGLLDGSLASAFSKKPALSEEDLENKTLVTNFNNLPAHVLNADKNARVLLVSDADFLMDEIIVERVRFFGQVINQTRNDNLALFFAAANDLLGDQEFSLIKPKSVGTRPFERFLSLQREAQIKYNETEKVLENKLKEAEASLESLRPKQGSSNLEFSEETLTKIREYQALELQTKRDLRDIRKLLREDIDFLKNILIVINLFFIPIVMTFIGIRIYAKRVRRS